MSRISDIIEKFITELINESHGEIEIQRNEMANQFNCAPSQINYVLMTRFTSDRGYNIESRRGGGGFIKITRVVLNEGDYLSELLTRRIGSSINKESAFDLLDILHGNRILDDQQRKILRTAVDDNTLNTIPRPLRDVLRADILKALILSVL